MITSFMNLLLTFALLLCALVLPDSSLADKGSKAPKYSFAGSIDVLRSEGRYEEALDMVRSQLEGEHAKSRPSYLLVTELPKWIETLELITKLPPAAQRELVVADSLWWKQHRHWEAGRYSAGIDALERRLDIVQRYFGVRHWEVARTHDRLANFLAAAGDYARAKHHYGIALELFTESSGRVSFDVAHVVEHVGSVCAAEGDLAMAEQLYREALALYSEVLQRARQPLLKDENVMRTWRRMANLYIAQGDYARAIPLLRKVELGARRLETTRRKGRGYWLTAAILGDLGEVLQKQGDCSAAVPVLREALAERRKVLGEEHPHVIWSLNALGEALCQCGEPAAAEPFLREALARCRKFLGDEDPYTATTFLSLASLLRSTGEYSAAETLAVQAMRIQRRSQGCVDLYIAECLSHLADTHLAQGKYGEAASCLREALERYGRVVGRDHPDVVAAMHNLGRCILAQDDPAGAEGFLLEAAAAFETARLRVGSGYSRAAFQESPYAALAATRLILGKEDEAWPAAERMLGRALADLIIAAEARSLNREESALQDSLQQLLGQLEDKLATFQAATPADTARLSSDDIDDVQIRLAAADAAWTAFQRDIARRHPVTEGRAFSLERVQRTLADRTALVGWLHVKVSAGVFATWGYVIRSEGPVHWVRLDTGTHEGDAYSPMEKARDFRDALAIAASWTVRPTDVSRLKGEAANLCERWVTPLEVHLGGVEQLIVVPSGPMLGLPIEALVDSDDVFLADRYTISYAPSATLHTWLSEQGVHEGEPVYRKALLVGDPPYTSDQLAAMKQERELRGPSFEDLLMAAGSLPNESVLRSALAGNQEALAALPRLPWTREEVRRVAAVIPDATILVGREASEQRLVTLAESGALREFDTIHLATHALVDDERPERSALVLSRVGLPDPYEAIVAGTRIEDGLLTAKEIVREWNLEADLVTLSGCQTGLGKQTAGEGYIGLAHAFLQAGARSLLVSLWKVEEEATALLMTRFYENLTGRYADEREGRRGEPMSKAAALREAKRWLRRYTRQSASDGEIYEPFRHPCYWSGFVLIGEP